MIKVKQTGLPVDGTTWSYGPDNMRQISIRDAGGLCGMYGLPKMGEEMLIGIKPDPIYSGFKKRLFVQNIAGAYFIASTDAKVCDWPAVFGVEVIEPAAAAVKPPTACPSLCTHGKGFNCGQCWHKAH
jgi:hypothetical protein